jgi:hypothetical protein
MILVTGGTGAIGAVPRSKDVACLTVVPSELVVRPARRSVGRLRDTRPYLARPGRPSPKRESANHPLHVRTCPQPKRSAER